MQGMEVCRQCAREHNLTMTNIPLNKFREISFPLTPKSTMNLWALQAFYQNRGPLAGRVRKYGKRWYVIINNDSVENVVENIKLIVSED